MKVTKVAKTRIAVSSKKNGVDGRGFLYPTPNDAQSVNSVEKQVEDRVEAANKLYGVFFASDNTSVLEGHFAELVKIANHSENASQFIKNASQFIKNALKYKGFESENKFGKVIFNNVLKFTYTSGNKNLGAVLEQHVKLRMTDDWGNKQYRFATVAILLCICDKDYQGRIKSLDLEKVEVFLEAARNYPNPYIYPSTVLLEGIFSSVMKQMAQCPDTKFEQKIQCLKQLTIAETGRGKSTKTHDLRKFSYKYATEERMKAVLVRMRKSLKRGTNADVAVMLLQGIAQMDGKDLACVLDELCAKEDTREALEKFILAVDEDYHKTAIIKSIKNHDVKVQVQDNELELSSANIEKVSEKKKNKIAITNTLERYASSPEAAVETLLAVKSVLLDFFMWNEADTKAEFACADKLWSIPNRVEEFFDMDFEPVDPKKDEKVEARVNLTELFAFERPNMKNIKARINYVNCGKYQQLAKGEEDAFRLFWIGYVKDYVEKNYVAKKKKLLAEECYKTRMLLACWKDTVRYICGKYIDIGKAVYHFAMPEDLSPKNHVSYGVLSEKYQDGISSFAYEAIKAEENIQRDIAKATVAASSAFSRSIIDADKHQAMMEERRGLEDILFMKKEDILACAKEDKLAIKQLLRFYGGYSKVKGLEGVEAEGLIVELLSHIRAIRNENFHFTKGKEVALDTVYSQKLWENAIAGYKQTIREKYYTNNVAMFYPQDKICELVKMLYQKDEVAESQTPAFRSIWQRKILPEYIAEMSLAWKQTDPTHVIFEGALYFLLKEIYYRDFVFAKEAKQMFFDAVDTYAKDRETESNNDRNNREKKALANSGKNFKEYVDALKKKDLTLAQVCQFINMEYNQQNRGQETEIYKHFKMLLPLCMRNAFQKYIEMHYGFIKQPIYAEKTTEEYLENVDVICMEMKPELMHWFTFAHFIHPRQLNFLVGDFKDYIQYRQDVLRRAGYAGQLADKEEKDAETARVQETIKKAQNILEVLEFVRNISGRVSNEFTDYYPNVDAFKKYMSQYIESDVVLENYDIYADAKNAKIQRNIELARMYAGGDSVLPNYPKITKAEIEKYYAEKDIVAQIQSQGICKSKEDMERVVEFQKLKGRITLNEVTELFSLVNDLLGQLVSLCYLRERDEMYLLLGFYHMALRNPDGWKNEVLDSVATEKYAVDKGLVFYQVVSAFDFGAKILYPTADGKWKETDYQTKKKLEEMHAESLKYIIPLFEVGKYAKKANDIRNYVDHSKYYVDHAYSIMDLYSQFYTGCFGYSSKLRKSILFNLQTMLERYLVAPKLNFDGVTSIMFARGTKSQEFTYKYEETNARNNKTIVKTLNVPAKTDIYIKAVQDLLNYKR